MRKILFKSTVLMLVFVISFNLLGMSAMADNSNPAEGIAVLEDSSGSIQNPEPSPSEEVTQEASPSAEVSLEAPPSAEVSPEPSPSMEVSPTPSGDEPVESQLPAPATWTVTFVDSTGAVIAAQTVEDGKAATAPEAPAVSGYTFSGWDEDFSAVTSDLAVTALYTEDVPLVMGAMRLIEPAAITTYTLNVYIYRGAQDTDLIQTIPLTGLLLSQINELQGYSGINLIHILQGAPYNAAISGVSNPVLPSELVSNGTPGLYEISTGVYGVNIHIKNGTATYTITASAGAGGSISPNGNVTVNSGANQSFSFTPATGYHVSQILVDGSPVALANSYTFTNVTASHTIAVSFAADTYTITASAGAGGSISPAGNVTVNSGANQSFKITQ